jgi:hypothetical protein
MKYRILAIGCVVYALALLATYHLAPSLTPIGLAVGYGFAGVAAIVTALSYARGDRLRWAWLAFGGGYLIAFVSKVFIGDNAAVTTFSPTRVLLWGIAILLLNIGSVTGLALFASVWSGTGLAPRWRWRATFIFLAIALVLDGPGIYTALRGVFGGTRFAFGALLSSSGDLIAIALVGPIFATAVALRGGILMRPWLFLFFATVSWLADDCAFALPRDLALNVDVVVRSLALTLSGAAALAQLWVKHEVRSSLDA